VPLSGTVYADAAFQQTILPLIRNTFIIRLFCMKPPAGTASLTRESDAVKLFICGIEIFPGYLHPLFL
jgi:hypothetical protein